MVTMKLKEYRFNITLTKRKNANAPHKRKMQTHAQMQRQKIKPFPFPLSSGFLHKLSSTQTKARTALCKMMVSMAASNRMPSFFQNSNAGLAKPQSAPEEGLLQPEVSGGQQRGQAHLSLGCAPTASLPSPSLGKPWQAPGCKPVPPH